MGTTLTGTKPKDTYDSLIKVGDNGPIGATAKTLSDGLGNDLPISVSTSNVGIGTPATDKKLTVKGTVSLRNDEVAAGYTTLDIIPATAIGASANRIAALNTTDIAFETGGAERARITANGLTFNGDTAAANALDDYEEGTWTIGITFGGASVGVTTLNNTGTYTKIGRQVTVNGRLSLTSKGSSTGSAEISGLPFTIGNTQSNYSAPSFRLANISFTNVPQAFGLINGTSIALEEITILGADSALTNADFVNTSDIMLSFTYFV
jgi:hypothetical protein